MKGYCTLLFAFCYTVAHAQYAPQVGQAGSDAISMYSSVFTSWASHCTVQRGLMNIADPSLGYASAGDSSQAIGAADGAVVCLGDSGVAVLTFASPVYNGPGADFAVFENGFINDADSTEAFLELGFVEVSSDGSNYFRFPATSLTDADVQIWNGEYITASKINNLAGKYLGGWGTPFDLEQLVGTPGLDINRITHVRIIDVVGDIGSHASRDSGDGIINDPFPTPFPIGGFDLDAVGVIHAVATGISAMHSDISLSIFPNPATSDLYVNVKNSSGDMQLTILSVTGVILQQATLSGQTNAISLGLLPAGMYYVTVQGANGAKWVEKITKL